MINFKTANGHIDKGIITYLDVCFENLVVAKIWVSKLKTKYYTNKPATYEPAHSFAPILDI